MLISIWLRLFIIKLHSRYDTNKSSLEDIRPWHISKKDPAGYQELIKNLKTEYPLQKQELVLQHEQ